MNALGFGGPQAGDIDRYILGITAYNADIWTYWTTSRRSDLLR
jgi:hypothetical protein